MTRDAQILFFEAHNLNDRYASSEARNRTTMDNTYVDKTMMTTMMIATRAIKATVAANMYM